MSCCDEQVCSEAKLTDCWSSAALYALNLPFYVLTGLGAPLLWTGQNVYLARCAVRTVSERYPTTVQAYHVPLACNVCTAYDNSNVQRPLSQSDV